MNFVFVHCLCFYHGKSRETISQQKGTLCSTMKIFLCRYYTFIAIFHFKNVFNWYRGIQGNTGEYKGIQENTGEYKGIEGNTGEYRRIQGNTGEYQGIQENTRENKRIQRNTRDKRIQTREYNRIQGNRGNTKEYRGIRENTLENTILTLNTWKKGQITLNTKPHADPL